MQVGPEKNCSLCARLVSYLEELKTAIPDGHNAPVPAFGDLNAELLVVGLAPGARGANRTGRPFTGDFAGELLYRTLLKFGFATGVYGASPDDGLELINCRITNAVRCVPPENKPTTQEIRTCNGFLRAETAAMPRLKIILSLGLISPNAVLDALNARKTAFKFAHGAAHKTGRITLIDSYHCSRYNTNTGVLTTEMFVNVFREIARFLDNSIQEFPQP
jgi:uracil-DNA glycosylase family 4